MTIILTESEKKVFGNLIVRRNAEHPRKWELSDVVKLSNEDLNLVILVNRKLIAAAESELEIGASRRKKTQAKAVKKQGRSRK